MAQAILRDVKELRPSAWIYWQPFEPDVPGYGWGWQPYGWLGYDYYPWAWLGFGSLAPSNPNWYIPSVALTAFPGPQPPGTPPPPNPSLKYMVMRPRPIDQLLANVFVLAQFD